MASYDLDLIESGRQDSNLRPSAPKAPATQNATAPMRNKWGYSLLVGITGGKMSLSIASICSNVLHSYVNDRPRIAHLWKQEKR